MALKAGVTKTWQWLHVAERVFFLSAIIMKVIVVVQTVMNLLMMLETWVQSLSQEDPLEKEMATYSSILAWKMLPKGAILSHNIFSE